MLTRGAVKTLQGLLKPFGQGSIGLTAEDYLDVAPAAVGQTEVIKPMIQGLSCNGDGDVLQFGEVGQPQAASLLALAEHHFFIGTMKRLPGLHAALKGALDLVGKTAGMSILEILEQGGGRQCGCLLE